MSKRKPPSKKTHPARKGRSGAADRQKSQDHGKAPSAQPARSHVPSPAAVRETIESVVVAFVLAFLFRTFEAEAFVIPTGSMAPTLMGRHKDLVCPKCGYPYQASASEEVDAETGAVVGPPVESCTCPICRYTADVGNSNPQQETYPSFKGDRILVGKFCYQFSDPERWDVAVFRYPGGAKTNFIKRFVGLSGETIRIQHGDIFVKGDGDGDFTIARKPPEKLLGILQPVFDNDYAPQIVEQGWPARWNPSPSPDRSAAGVWHRSEDFRRFETDGAADGETWLRYEHLVPSAYDWAEQQRAPAVDQARPERSLKPRLISDFCAYNTSRSAYDRDPYGDNFGLQWVGDLTLMCTLEVLSDSGQAVFELVEGGRPMQCRIDVATGTATLTIGGTDSDGRVARTIDGKEYRPTAQTDIRGPGEHEIIFANVDDQLRLWVDGRLVRFGGSDAATRYALLNNSRPQAGNSESDLSPVGIASGGAALRVSHLKIFRDVYYIAKQHHTRSESFSDFNDIRLPRDLLSRPDQWDAFEDIRHVDFVLGDDQFLALGDNSPKSKDSRLWEQEGFEYFVSRDLLIGKALFIYWPHSWNKLPGTNIPFPFFPNFQRTGFVR